MNTAGTVTFTIYFFKCFLYNCTITIFPAVQEERGPRKPKACFNPKHICNKIPTPSVTNFAPVHPHQELAAQILLVATRQARFNSGFGLLNRDSQNEILRYLWAPLFILRAAFWPIETEDILLETRKSFTLLRDLKIDASEIELMENLLLCRPDLISDQTQSILAQTMREKAIETLAVVICNGRIIWKSNAYNFLDFRCVQQLTESTV